MSVICLAVLSLRSALLAAAPDFTAYAGNYRLAANEVIAIAEWELDPSSPHVLAFTNLKTGRIGVLTDLGDDEFALREGLLAGPQVAAIRFIRSRDRVIALTYAPSGGRPLRAQRVETRREELIVDAGDVRLRATLYLPAGHEPFPVIVIVPAGALGRTGAATFPNFFVARASPCWRTTADPDLRNSQRTRRTRLRQSSTSAGALTSTRERSACGVTVKAAGYRSSRLPNHPQSPS